MATASVQYYSGTTLLGCAFPLKNDRFYAIGGERNKHNAYDSFHRMVGEPAEGPKAVLPVTRKIFYKRHPSLHKCDARCMNAKGHNCECSCGGKNHGAAA